MISVVTKIKFDENYTSSFFLWDTVLDLVSQKDVYDLTIFENVHVHRYVIINRSDSIY